MTQSHKRLDRQAGLSIAETMVASAIVVVCLALASRQLNTNFRAQQTRSELQGLDLFDMEFRQNIVSGGPAGLAAGITNLTPALSNCLFRTGTCQAGAVHDAAFQLPDNPHSPPRLNGDGRACTEARPSVRACPFVLDVRIVSACERDVPTCPAAQAHVVTYHLRNLGSFGRAERRGRLVIKGY